MPNTTFADRLTLILKALSVSRGRLAADVGVDKSVVGKWCRGTITPSGYNLARLTQYIAEHHPGFTLHDWDTDLDTLAASFGVKSPTLGEMDSHGILPPKIEAEAAAAALAYGKNYEGIWRSTRPCPEVPGQFINDPMMLRRRPDGALGLTLAVMDVRYRGVLLFLKSHFFAILTDEASGNLAFAIINGLPRARPEVVDGLIMATVRGPTPTACASRCLMTRVADLGDDPEADDERFEAAAKEYPLTAPEALPADIRDHLWQDSGPTPYANGGDAILMLGLANSMARGPLFAEFAENWVAAGAG